MMSAPALLRAYLETQADFGTDEVILPYPLIRRQDPLPPVRQASGHPEAEPSPTGTQAAVPGGTGRGGLPPGEEPAGLRSAESLFATLSQAMSDAPRTVAVSPTPRSRPESAALPDFPDLPAFWTYLASRPGIAAGDPEAKVLRVIEAQGPAGGPLALIGLEPGEADTATGRAFAGEPGILLAKMLKAIRLDAEACYRTHLVKAARATRATRRDLGRLLPWLHAELGLAKAPFALLLGEACAQAVLKTGKPIEELRQEPFRIEGREFAVTYHPSELLAREELKKKAWEDLQWLQKRMAEGA